ncbi:MAG: hypothetical protein OHK0028_00080 [Deltaproteobacteria bacterium]
MDPIHGKSSAAGSCGLPGNGARTPALRNAVVLCWALLACAGCGGSGSTAPAVITVDSLVDADPPPSGSMTLRAAIRELRPGGTITFDPSLDNGTVSLSIVGSDNTVLKGETYDNTMKFTGYAERNYGKSALFARKDLVIDASALPDGITLKWAGGDANPARVLAVYGDLTMRNVTVTSGISAAEPIGGAQKFTLARGGGLAVWGTATLDRCTVGGNRCAGDTDFPPPRDRGAFGGGIYANAVVLTNCVVSGNSVTGYGAAGGGIYSVGGADGPGIDSSLSGCAVTGNRITGQYAYGGGVFTLGGGPDFLKSMTITNCTIARNVVEDHPGIAQSNLYQYYYRGGGVYLGGGTLTVDGCTIAENEVTGVPWMFRGKPNMGGGGIAATIGDAHVVESITIRQSIVAGNTLNGSAEDLFTGSLLHFYSHGYNLLGRIDFRQILVPIPKWWSLSRKHWPKTGDLDNVAASDVLDLPNAARHAWVRSAGTDNGEAAILWYPPKGIARDRIPAGGYMVDNIVLAQYQVASGSKDDFLPRLLDRLSTGEYGAILGSGFGAAYRAAFEAAYGVPLDNVAWYETPSGWPSDPANVPWINFWRGLDNAIGGSLGTVQLGDAFWGSFPNGPLGDNVTMRVSITRAGPFLPAVTDQIGNPRRGGSTSDVGAIERVP